MVSGGLLSSHSLMAASVALSGRPGSGPRRRPGAAGTTFEPSSGSGLASIRGDRSSQARRPSRCGMLAHGVDQRVIMEFSASVEPDPDCRDVDSSAVDAAALVVARTGHRPARAEMAPELVVPSCQSDTTAATPAAGRGCDTTGHSCRSGGLLVTGIPVGFVNHSAPAGRQYVRILNYRMQLFCGAGWPGRGGFSQNATPPRTCAPFSHSCGLSRGCFSWRG